MESLRSINPAVPTIILTGHGSVESAVEAMRRGAYSYLTKPFEPGDLLLQIERALENRKLATENVKGLKDLLDERYDFANIVAAAPRCARSSMSFRALPSSIPPSTFTARAVPAKN